MRARVPLRATEDSNGYITRRSAIDLLRNRIDLLAGRDRLIMKLYLDNGISARRIAALLDVSPSTIARKVRSLSTRLLAVKYRYCQGEIPCLTDEEIEIATDHFVRGNSLRTIAEEKNYSFYRVRETIKKIKQAALSANNIHKRNPSHLKTISAAQRASPIPHSCGHNRAISE